MQLFYLVKYLDLKKYKIFIITTSKSNLHTSMHNKFKNLGIEILDLEYSKIESIFFSKYRIQSFIDFNKIDIVQSYGFRTDIIVSDLKNALKITSVRNTLLLNYKFIYNPIIGTVLGQINLYYIKKFNFVLSCSNSIKKYLESLGIFSETILNSLDPDLVTYKKNEGEYNELVEKFKIHSFEKNFITVSSKLKGKNVEFLIKSFLDSSFSQYSLLIAGFVDPEFKLKYRHYHNIIFLGHVTNIAVFFKFSDFFISASYHEGMPNAVLEAMACGTPVLLSDIPSHKEIFNMASMEIGGIFENDNFDDFIYNLNRTLNYDYLSLSKNCNDFILEYFNAKKMAKSYEEFYSGILNKRFN
jgi:glycosyltransferase involved in cell wall biosynthesis